VLLKHESDVQKAKRALTGGRTHPIERDNRDQRGGSQRRRFGNEWNN
jgi:hypothetical protein